MRSVIEQEVGLATRSVAVEVNGSKLTAMKAVLEDFGGDPRVAERASQRMRPELFGRVDTEHPTRDARVVITDHYCEPDTNSATSESHDRVV